MSVTPALRAHPSAWALWPMTAATWIAFAQVVSFQGLAIWVIGGSLLTALAVLPLAQAGRRAWAFVAMVAMTLLVPVLAETLGGTAAGPVTRASLMACSAVGAMALVLPGRYPVALVPISLLLLMGAIGLGAAERAPWLVGLWSVAAAVTIAMVGPFRQHNLRDRRRLVPFALMLVGVGSVAVVAIALVAPWLTDPWTIPGSGSITATAEGAAPELPAPPTTEVTPITHPPSTAESAPVAPEPPVSELPWLLIALLVVLALFLLIVLVLLVARLVVWLLWWRLRLSLSSGTPEQRVIGAWTWLRLRRARMDRPLPRHVSPDVAVTWAVAAGEPDVLAVARLAASVAFNPSGALAPDHADRAWAAARAAGRPTGGTLRSRWRWAGRTPARVRSTLDAPAAVAESIRG